MAEIIDGKSVSADLRAQLKTKVEKMKQAGVTPGLAVVLLGEDPASKSYVTAKERSCGDLGMMSRDIRLPSETSEEELLALVEKLNKDSEIDGILVQLPLPSHIDENKVILAIDPSKDVDGFHPVSVGKMVLEQDTFLPCTPHGILKLLEFKNISPSGKKLWL